MEKIILIVVAISLMALMYSPIEQAEESLNIKLLPEYNRFIAWCSKHSKVYRSIQEQEHRFHIFTENQKMIETHNQSGSDVELEENKFMDLKYDEFKALMMKGRKRSGRYSIEELQEKVVYLNITELPEEVDWRSKAVPPIKDQGTCGGCWAFSTVGALEGAWAIKHSLETLSEQQIIDCCRLDLYGCNGGDPIVALEECVSRDGIMLGSDYPYTKVTSKKCLWDSDKVLYTPTDYAIVPHNDSMQLQMAVSQQPVAVCVSDSPIFHFYKKGVVLDSDKCGLDNDHCIVAVGYGNQDDKDYWLLRNSWGADWGDQGYLKVKRDHQLGPGICGIAMEATYVIV